MHEVELSPILLKMKNDENTGQRPSPERLREPTHTTKKQGGKRFPSQLYRSNFILNFTKTNFQQIFMVFTA